MLGSLSVAVDEQLIPRPERGDPDFIVGETVVGVVRGDDGYFFEVEEGERSIVLQIQISQVVKLALTQKMTIHDKIIRQIQLLQPPQAAHLLPQPPYLRQEIIAQIHRLQQRKITQREVFHSYNSVLAYIIEGVLSKRVVRHSHRHWLIGFINDIELEPSQDLRYLNLSIRAMEPIGVIEARGTLSHCYLSKLLSTKLKLCETFKLSILQRIQTPQFLIVYIA